jgi:hypothetical protein
MRGLLLLTALASGGWLLAAAQMVDPSPISGPALELTNELATTARRRFMVYGNSDSGENHGFPSGFFANSTLTLSKIHLDTACVADPSSATGCTTDPKRVDLARGTVMRVAFDPLRAGEFGGINMEEPRNWGVLQSGDGYDLRRATQVCFEAASPTPGLRVQFGVGGRTSAFRSIPATWTPICLNLRSLVDRF